MGKSRKNFDKEFKLNAIRELIESDKSAVELSKSLGVDANLLRQWKSRFINSQDVYFEDSEDSLTLEEENLQLKKKVAYLENELSVLKKAMAIFMRDRV